MKIIDADQVHASLNFAELIPLLKTSFAKEYSMPQRNVYLLDQHNPDNHDAFALLPAWNDEIIGNKAFTYFPSNNADPGLQSLYSKIMLFSRQSGEPLALVDGTSITYWRTAAVSALASQLLSRENSNHLMLFGTGNLARYLLHAHLTVRPINKVTLVGRNPDKVSRIINELSAQYTDVTFIASNNVAQEIPTADIICCATASKTPLFKGQWLMPGVHLDCLGNHHPNQRECDSQSITRARVYVDSLVNNLAEAGELLLPINEGCFEQGQIVAQLSDMCKSPRILRQSEQDITLFKSVGTAISDLVTAHHVYKSVTA
jgi:1-pyrroline-2-carboxylate reductase [NAD(P)H]